ncbi:LAFE_0E09450g1_1 [Lachancea fermentati]|uniref:UDP-N-acetylglucosamine diphosphorylase n=1 Tax=Lachancea fermentati TaxID=4955 RepID=A0A1G4MDC8_LACFM|nr:LAFE_0E09450g1_1 [Lachancea fermentati]
MSITDVYKKANQSHLFNEWNNLNDAQRRQFEENLRQVSHRVSPSAIVRDCQKALKLAEDNASASSPIEPLPEYSYESIIGNPEIEDEYQKLGLAAIARGEVAVILMAGGQGTRLGSSQPKGCYNIGLPSGKSLFQIQAEKLLRLQKLAQSHKPIPWYIMTSKPTREPTEQFFKEHSYFGLSPQQITFFNQGTLPALDLEGAKLLQSSPTELVESPDGNGGLYRAIKDNKLLDDFVSNNIRHIHMYCVDNVLVKLADPVFIGYAIKHGFELATKAVRKRDAAESVGLIATKDGKPCVIEYSEISKEMAEAKDDQGLLKLRAANIVNHYYAVDLLERKLDEWCDTMPYHIAKKKIPFYNNTDGSYIKPSEPNGIKLEQFIFDVFPSVPLEKFGCLEVYREKEFAPLKNAPGSANDNPETSRAAYLNLTTSWLKEVGAQVNDGVHVEVSGRVSYAGESLESYKDEIFDQDNALVE